MPELVLGSQVLYALSEEEAQDINRQIAKYPDRQPVGTQVHAGQRMPATVLLTRGPHDAGEEQLTLRLDGTTPVEKAYHVAAADLSFEDGAWRQMQGGA